MLMKKAATGEKITIEEALKTYADPKNWETIVVDPKKGCHWVWKGPVICAYELAELAFKDK